MTAHQAWLELAAAEPAFPLGAADRHALDGHLEDCADCRRRAAAMRVDMTAIADVGTGRPTRDVEDRIRLALLAPVGLSGRVVAALFLALLTVSTLGAVSLGVGAFGRGPAEGPDAFAGIGAGKPIVWQNEIVLLAADAVTIEANGLAFHGPADARVEGDHGGLTRWSLEVSWLEHGRSQRLNLHFRADATGWWVDEIQTYDGLPKSEWAMFPRGPHVKAPLGSDQRGDLEIVGTGAGGDVRLRIANFLLHVAPQPAFAAPPGGGRALPENATPFAPGTPLHCSGILQMSPAQAHDALLGLGYRVTWRLVERYNETESYWHVRAAPPEGLIWASWDPVVSTDGAIIIAVLPLTDPKAAQAPFPEDCPVPAVPSPAG